MDLLKKQSGSCRFFLSYDQDEILASTLWDYPGLYPLGLPGVLGLAGQKVDRLTDPIAKAPEGRYE